MVIRMRSAAALSAARTTSTVTASIGTFPMRPSSRVTRPTLPLTLSLAPGGGEGSKRLRLPRRGRGSGEGGVCARMIFVRLSRAPGDVDDEAAVFLDRQDVAAIDDRGGPRLLDGGRPLDRLARPQ